LLRSVEVSGGGSALAGFPGRCAQFLSFDIRIALWCLDLGRDPLIQVNEDAARAR